MIIFSANGVVLASPLEERVETVENPLSFGGVTLEELCKQASNFLKVG